MNRRKIWLFFILVFITGVLVGMAGMQLFVQTRIGSFVHGGAEHRQGYFQRWLDRELKLTASQHASIEAITRDTHEKLLGLRQRNQPEVQRIILENRQRIETFLTPEQTAHFREMMTQITPPWTRGTTNRMDRGTRPPGT